MPLAKHCVNCHQDIMGGKFKAAPDKIAKWKKTVVHYWDIPSLEGAGNRFKEDWIAQFLRAPKDLRPHMKSTMPFLEVSAQDAADIAAHLTKDKKAPPKAKPGDASRGREILDTKTCGTCHLMSGVTELKDKPDPNATGDALRAIDLAPDLRFTRERWDHDHLVAWLLDPPGVKKGTRMPNLALTQKEAEDAASYLLTTPLEEIKTSMPKRLPVLDRPVSYKEVDERVFHKTCRHCHTDADAALGDGGPGNTGGFGFKPRKLDLSSYRGASAGVLDKKTGERVSVFQKLADGTPRLVATLWARHTEEVLHQSNPEVRGMPIGLPPVSPEDIQLVESWIAQGRPQ
jgi:cytochrome c2